MLELWTNPMSRGRIAHWMMEELGQPYDIHWLDYGPEGHKSAAYLAINPMGKIPTLRHDGRVITETAAICLYLAETFPEAGLKPQGDALADYYRWTLFAAGPVEQAVTSKAMGWEAPAERAGMLGFGSFDQTISVLSDWLAGRDYVCGDAFSAADVYVGAQVRWGLQIGTLPQLESFTTYAARMAERPAYERMLEANAARLPSEGG